MVLFSAWFRGNASRTVGIFRLVFPARIYSDRLLDTDFNHGGAELSIQQTHQNNCDRPDRSLVSFGVLSWLSSCRAVRRAEILSTGSCRSGRPDPVASMGCHPEATRPNEAKRKS